MATPVPKDPKKRARRNKDVAPVRYIAPARLVVQPDLPEFEVEVRPKDGEPYMVPYSWPDATRGWWAMLADHPLASEFFDADWQYLLDTALVHASFWKGNLGVAGELRLREAKYGFTPEDRAKLRIFSAAATEGEVKAHQAVEKVQSSRDRYGSAKRLEA